MKRFFPLAKIAALVASLASVPVVAQDNIGFSSLEERMTAAEFRATGLDKLSDQELAALNEWIRMRSLAEQEALALAEQQQQRSGPVPIEDMPEEPFEANLVGPFDGWSGKTEFVLDNGMVWQQTGNDRYPMAPMESPKVLIRPGLFGGWTLQIEGYNKRTNVERIR
ncbi:hypothetical protein HFP89_07655 [Wenzhouxiangella sp. XN79A]|uniref:hypothetical protein n=1 Tax=Wenzhouxiangella sp. XN79A TaxID=2724193 RepID=UPI00144A7F5F|nr:hypothetical protein [Wenzhouxiangella sp. XN79A]NKI35038.1 hypothetical protein [Wenzhouxiangella sp. XN79A]